MNSPIVLATLMLLGIGVPVSPAAAHEKGALYLGSREVAAGRRLAVRGEKLGKNAEIQLRLRGPLQTYPLTAVRTDSAGAFRLELAIPPEVRAGSYSILAVASDGDVTARTDLTVLAAQPATDAPPHDMAAMDADSSEMAAGMPQMTGRHATGAAMELDRTTTPAEWVGISVIVLVALGGGFALLRRAAA